MNLSQQILQRLRHILVDEDKTYALHEPDFSGNESKYVQDCLQTGWVSSVGNYVNQFELQLAAFTGVEYAIATVNGTAALHTCFMVADVEAGDEVLVPTLTFVATANAVQYCGAIPHFVDADLMTMAVSAQKLADYLAQITIIKNDVCYNRETNRRIKALCVTHIFGHPAELDALQSICRKFHITLIEDAAEALGSYYRAQHVGNFSLVAALSFNGNKIITTGGGGAVLTNNQLIAEKARHLTTTARVQHQWQFSHDHVGYNYRLPNINAALGCAQLERLETYLLQKRKLADRYKEIFSDIDGVTLFSEPANAKSNYWLNALLFKHEDEQLHNQLLAVLHNNHIFSRPIWQLIHRLPMYANCPRMNLANAENLVARTVLLPSSPTIVS